MRVLIIGAGVVGRATGIGLARVGHTAAFHDVDSAKLSDLQVQGYGTLDRLLLDVACDVYMLCLPTPLCGGTLALADLETALKALAAAMPRSGSHQVVAIRSTVLPHTTSRVLAPLFRRHCRLEAGRDYSVCHNPEFLRQAHALEDFLASPLAVIGTEDPQAEAVMKELYRPLGCEVLMTTPENAEAVKVLSNGYNAMKVSFFNTIYLLAGQTGLDHGVVSHALTRTSLGVRIPEYYTRGGSPFGGGCLPKDVTALISFLEVGGLDSDLLRAVLRVNERVARETNA